MPAHPQPFRPLYRDLFWTVAALCLVLAWDASGLDWALARPWASAQGFALREHWLFSTVLHDAASRIAWLPCLWLVAGIWWPTGVLRRLSRAERVQWAVTTLVSLALISVLKQTSQVSCPWDLVEFGGAGHAGHCFPAGHASAGFAFLSGYTALRTRFPGQARVWLAGALLAGTVLGIAQQLRGAHFMSHTLWTAWLCWTVACAGDLVARWAAAQSEQAARAPTLVN